MEGSRTDYALICYEQICNYSVSKDKDGEWLKRRGFIILMRLFQILMKSTLDLNLLEQLPPQIRKLISKPYANCISFDALTDSNIENAVNYVKTKTAIELLSPWKIGEREAKKYDRPIVLVLCQPSEELNLQKNEIFPYAPVSYSAWLEAAGASCIPLPYNINEGSLQFLLERSHGLVIPGGGANLYKSYETKEGFGPMTVGFMKIFRYIQKMWAKGINYPIWGTCLGLEVMLIALSNDIKILSNLNSRGHQQEIYSDYDNSRIMQKMPINLRLNLEHRKLINFAHMHGISVKKFLSSPKLVEKLRIVSVSKDKDGKWFCSAMEGRDRPVFLSQYHPQKQAFQWTKKGDILANKYSVEISQYFAESFLKECLKCKAEKTFVNAAELNFYCCQVFRQIYTPEKHYKIYLIDFKYRQYDRQQRKKIGDEQKPVTSKKIFI